MNTYKALIVFNWKKVKFALMIHSGNWTAWYRNQRTL